MKKMIDRINFLYHKSKENGLTEQEKLEQERLRKQYVKKSKLIFESKHKNFIYYEINTSVFEEVMLWFSQFGGKNENK